MDKSQIDLKSDSNVLSKKISKILESNLEHDKETLEALKGLSSLVIDNNLNERRNLRSKIEKQSLAVNEEFLKSFLDAKKYLDSLYDDMQTINKTCEDTLNRIKVAGNQTANLLHQTNHFKNERKKIRAKEIIADGFTDSFQLKPEEIMILRGSGSATSNLSDEIDERFFTILDKVKRIHQDSKILLMSNQQTTGIEVMDAMALHQEAAYERLYRWTLSNLRTITSDSVETNSQIFKAMQCLQERELLFKYAIDEFIIVRRATVVRNFIECLTRGKTTGSIPIESHSSDSIRYIGDIFAWIHQALASEKEILESLIKLCNQEDIKQTKLIESLLSSISESLSRPLKVRVEQALVSEQNAANKKIIPAMHYRIKNLIRFYHHIMSQKLLSDAVLLYTIEELYTLSYKIFFNSLNYHCVSKIGSTDANEIESPSVDLGPSQSLNQIISTLQEVLSCQDSCSISIDDLKQDIPQILSTVIDPLIRWCVISASKLDRIEMAIFLLNSFDGIYSVICNYEYTYKYKEILQSQMDSHIETLISEQVSHIIAFLGLSSLYNAVIQQDQLKMPLSSLSGCDALALQTSMKNMDSFLANPTSLFLPQVNLIRNQDAKKLFWDRSIGLVCSVYQQIYDAVNEPSNNYEDPSKIMHHKPETVKMLLI